MLELKFEIKIKMPSLQAPRLSVLLRAEEGDSHAIVDFAAAAARLHARLAQESSHVARAHVASGWPAAVLGDWKLSTCGAAAFYC